MIKSLFSYTLIPLLLLGHYFTQHSAFLFIVGFISAVALAIMLFAVVIIFIAIRADDHRVEEALKSLHSVPRWRIALTLAHTTACGIYLLYANAFVVFTLFFLAGVLGYFIRKITKPVA